MAKKTAEPEAPKTDVITAFKGFDANLQCRGHQFEVGKTYEVGGEIIPCGNGFHACEDPIDVWGYYGPGDSRFAIVEMSGEVARHEGDSKIASARITIKAELSLPDFIKRSVDFVLSRVDWANAKATNTGDRSAATNTGDQSATKVEGAHSVAMATGYEGRVSGANGCALFAVERNAAGEILSVASGIVGRDGLKADTWYVCKSGALTEIA